MSDNQIQVAVNNRIKRERFIRIAESRVNRILDNLDTLGKCSNIRNYEYTEQEVNKIFREIDRKVKETKLKFQVNGESRQRFRLLRGEQS